MEDKAKTNLIVGIIAVAAICVAIHFYINYEKEKNKRKIAERNNLKLILDAIHRNHDLTEEIQNQLIQLVKKFEKLNSKISRELAQALQLIQIGQVENAIEDVAKILENILKEYYKNDSNYKSWLGKQKDDFHNKLRFCKHEGKISKVEFDFFVAVKTVRNEEDHELDLTLPNYLTTSALIAGIGGVIKLSGLLYGSYSSMELVEKT